jgi:hypothetical protein
MVEALRPARGGFLRPFGCALFVREFLLGHSPNGAARDTRKTPWGIPIPDARDPNDPVFQRHPKECDCYRDGILRCGVACVWA